jgi:hypothetical protein
VVTITPPEVKAPVVSKKTTTIVENKVPVAEPKIVTKETTVIESKTPKDE